MKNLYILSAVFLAMLVAVVYSDDTPILPIPTECPKKDSLNFTVNIAHESNCSLFYSCQNGNKILLVCPKLNKEGDRLFFNPELQVCDWPDNVKCENKPEPGEGEGETGEGEGVEGGEGEGEEGDEGEIEEGGEGEGEEGGEGEGAKGGRGESVQQNVEKVEEEKAEEVVRENILSRMWMNRV